jgi:hypothetical protein
MLFVNMVCLTVARPKHLSAAASMLALLNEQTLK